jgi:hypothetical protein
MKTKILSRVSIALLIGIVLTGIFVGGIKFRDKYIVTKEIRTEAQIVFDLNDPFSEQKVRDYLTELRVKYVDIAVAQMKLESANGTSKVFREGNNLFGMREPGKRPTTALGTKNSHAYYSHWRQSVIDYAMFQAYVGNMENLASEEAWLDYIGRMYAECSTYKEAILKIKQKFKQNDSSKQQKS